MHDTIEKKLETFGEQMVNHNKANQKRFNILNSIKMTENEIILEFGTKKGQSEIMERWKEYFQELLYVWQNPVLKDKKKNADKKK